MAQTQKVTFFEALQLNQIRTVKWPVVSIGLSPSHFVHYLKMEYVRLSILAKKFPMETESYNSLGGTITLLALSAQRYISGQRYTEG